MAAKSVFKMAEAYFPLGGRVEITSFVMLIINFAPKVLCSKRILPKMLFGERCLKTAAFRWYQTCLVWCFFLDETSFCMSRYCENFFASCFCILFSILGFKRL